MLPNLLSVGPLSVSTYGVATALAFIIGAFVVWRAARDRGITDEKILDNIVVTAVVAFLLARVFFVLSHWSLFAPNVLRLFLVWKFPGLSLWGAVLAAVPAALFYARRQKLSTQVIFVCRM